MVNGGWGLLLGEELPDELRVAVEGVECERETEADDGAREEHSENDFFL